MSTITNTNSVLSHPDIPDDGSRGSSVSSGFVNEYEEILKYAIVAPKLQICSNPLLDGQRPIQSAYQNNNEYNESSTSTSSSSSTSTSPTEQRSKKEKEEAEVEVRVTQAKKAIEEHKSIATFFGNEKQLRFRQQTSNAMDTLLGMYFVTVL